MTPSTRLRALRAWFDRREERRAVREREKDQRAKAKAERTWARERLLEDLERREGERGVGEGSGAQFIF